MLILRMYHGKDFVLLSIHGIPAL